MKALTLLVIVVTTITSCSYNFDPEKYWDGLIAQEKAQCIKAGGTYESSFATGEHKCNAVSR